MSACLLGRPVRYDGRARESTDAVLLRWRDEGRLITLCPEIAGGLPVPRPPAEISPVPGSGMGSGVVRTDGQAVLDGSARVVTVSGDDVTEHFLRGAEQALALARAYSAKLAILKESSPSCALHRIYDGSFTGRSRAGAGVTSALLDRNGVRVFNENECVSAAGYLAALEASAL